MVIIKFKEGRDTAHDSSLKQWDYGRKLQVEGLVLPDGNIEVDFSLTEIEGDASTFFGTVKDNILTIDIPDFIFQKENTFNFPTYDAYAYIYQSDGESGRTIKKIVLTIDARPGRTTDVPDDKKDLFLEEVRGIMNETKEIAQSVRDDADNGEFDGEKGEKGDAGSIKFIIAPELPTENIDASAIYLVPTESETEQNKFLEYIYVNGSWECIGSASVEVSLADYVKNTDYATSEKGGVVKVYSGNGLSCDNGQLAIIKATNEEINGKTRNSMPIVPSNLDYAVMKALSDPKNHEWTEEEKASARNLLNALQKPTVGNGVIYLDGGLNMSVVKITDGTVASAYQIPRYAQGGVLPVGTPTMDEHATTKKYVDELFKSITDSEEVAF